MKKVICLLIVISLVSCKKHIETKKVSRIETSQEFVQMPVETDSSLVLIDTTATLVLKYDRIKWWLQNLTLVYDKIVYRDSVHAFPDRRKIDEYLSFESLTKLYSDGVHTYILLPINQFKDGDNYMLLYYEGNKLVDTKIFPFAISYLNDIDEDGIVEWAKYICSGDEPIFVDTISCIIKGADYCEVYKLNKCNLIYDSVLSDKVTQLAFPVFIEDTLWIEEYDYRVSLALDRVEELDLDHHTLAEEFELLKKNKILYPDSDE